MGCADGPLGRIAKADIATRSVHITDFSGAHTVRHSFFEWLDEDLEKNRISGNGIDIPFEFALGWMGYIGYEMKADNTANLAHPSPYPDATLLFCDRGIVIDHQEKQTHLLALSRRMMLTIKCNLSFSMGLNFLAIALAITGILNPVVGALVHNAGSVLVIVNSAFLLGWKKRKA